MARLIYIAGGSGTGKSTSLMKLNPETSFILNADTNDLPFNYEEKFNEKAGNYRLGSSISDVKQALKTVNDNHKVNIMVVDTWSRIMTDYIMSKQFRSASDGRKAWGKFAQDMYDLIDTINNSMRKDLTVFLLCHTETNFSDTSIIKERIQTHGQMINKFVPESFSTVVLYTHVEVIPGQKPVFSFRTETSGVDTCKSPIGMFKESLIPNDLNEVFKAVHEFYK